MIESVGESKVPASVIEHAVTSLDKYITLHYGSSKRRTLRRRQMTVFEDLRNSLGGSQTEGYVALPTGVGKTVLFTEFIEATGLESLIVVPTRLLVDQTEERFKQFAPDIEVGKLYANAHDLTRSVTITTYASLVRHVADGTLDPNLYKLLVLDEVHRSLSQKRRAAVLQFGEAIKIGFTATPVYSQDRQVANLLNTEIHKMTIREAVEENLLSPFSAYIAQSDIDLSNVSITSSRDYDQRELEQTINIASRNQAAVDLYQKLFPDQTAVAYCITIKHAQELAQLFRDSGISAGHISGKQSKKEQEETLQQFRSGQIKVLCNADILIEGFDEPKASVCLNVRPTLSVVVAQQRAGRVLRLDPDNRNKHAYVVDFIDETQDTRKLPVTFAEVAEAAIILSKNGDNESGGKSKDGSKEDHKDKIVEDVIEISGLKVITNAEEVLRIVKGIQEEKLIEVQETDFVISDANIVNTFIGGVYRLRPITRELVHSNSALIAFRKSGHGPPIMVATNRDLFLSLMQKAGFMLKEDRIKQGVVPASDSELVISDSSLRRNFIGNSDRIKKIAQEVVQFIRQQHPDLIVERTVRGHPAIACTNPKIFIGEMSNRGVALNPDPSKPKSKPKTKPTAAKPKTSSKQELRLTQTTDFILSARSLQNAFHGGRELLRNLANQNIGTIKEQHPDFITTAKTSKGGAIVTVCTDRDLFIRYMLEAGVQLRE